MKVNRVFLVATASVISAVAVSSCAYQPYYSSPSYSSGYGYGYGSRNFTTTHFIRTSSSRWGYDPYTRCYYDYSRRCYYDPYLNGYYPVGYRPVYVHGAPHPHGWRTGHSYIAPPSRIYDHRLDNYQNRTERYRSLNTDWSRNIKPTSTPRSYDTQQNRYDRHPSYDRNRESRSGSFFGTSLNNQRSRTENRDPNTYVNTTQDRRRSEPRISEPQREAQRTIRHNQMNHEERSNRSNRQSNPGIERGGPKVEEEKPEAFRQPEKQENPRMRQQEDRHNQAPSHRNLRMENAEE